MVGSGGVTLVPSTTPSIRVVKSFSYRGSARLFSNRYHFNGGVPSSLANWYALMDAIVLAEKAVHQSPITIVECVAYEAGSELPVASKTYSTVGTCSASSVVAAPGQDAALVRYATTARSSRNHPIYLFNYYHGCGYQTGVSPDTLATSEKTALETYADAWLAGIAGGGVTAVRAGPHGATATARLVHPEITHRDFPA